MATNITYTEEVPENTDDKVDIHLLPSELRRESKTLATSISILVTGKTGSGKSTLIKGLLRLNPDTHITTVKAYLKKEKEIEITLWDSPGLQDGTDNDEEYLRQMKGLCSERDLTLYCIKIDTRLVPGSDEARAIGKLTEAFGEDFWKTTIIVLTFANVYDMIDKDWDFSSDEKQLAIYKAKIEQWERQIREMLINVIKVSEEIVKEITIVPAGYYKSPHLPGYDNWLSNIWLQCCSIIPIPEKQAALVKLNSDRFKQEKNVKQTDFGKSPEEQQIVFKDTVTPKAVASGIVGAAIGAVVGGGVGATGFAAGFIAGITIPAGVILGGAIGYLTTAIITQQALKKKKKPTTMHETVTPANNNNNQCL